ncbi:MAG: PqqD family protein [Candidatus Omnitrophica bacterium]|nr:PqqD family protein [Candidatus Omnitrophota bacterium]
MLWKGKIPFKSPEVAWRTVDGESIIVLTKESRVIVLNEVGTYIWELIDGRRSFQEIVTAVTEEFEVSALRATEESAAFLEEIAAKGIIFLKDKD